VSSTEKENSWEGRSPQTYIVSGSDVRASLTAYSSARILFVILGKKMARTDADLMQVS
jgi:hypothetical protein